MARHIGGLVLASAVSSLRLVKRRRVAKLPVPPRCRYRYAIAPRRFPATLYEAAFLPAMRRGFNSLQTHIFQRERQGAAGAFKGLPQPGPTGKRSSHGNEPVTEATLSGPDL
jgi:hypothetical protein